MSRRNSLEEKKRRRAAKLFRATPPAWIDLEEYVMVRAKCSRATAKKVILSGAIRIDSHPIGFKLTKNDGKEYAPMIPAKHRDALTVVAPEFLSKLQEKEAEAA